MLINSLIIIFTWCGVYYFSLARSLRSLEHTEIAEIIFFLAAVEKDGSQKPPQAFGHKCATAPRLFFIAGLSPAMKK
jgi:hypothetical protein